MTGVQTCALPILTISDEAFTLLLYDNYVEKWVKAFQQQEQHRLETMAAPQPASTAGGDGRRKASKEREKGKYTAQKTGHCKYEDGTVKEWPHTIVFITW